MSWVSGKTVLITGASGGIGRAAAMALANEGAELVLLCRSEARGEETRRTIARETGNEKTSLLLCDLASQARTRAAAAELLGRGTPLHVLFNNAGVFNVGREETEDGIEATWAVNHLGYFLLTNLLLERLKESAPARIVNVASDAHAWSGGPLDFDDLDGSGVVSPMRRYGRSKLANILFTRELGRRLAGTGVTAHCFHPGFVGSGFATNNGVVARLGMTLARAFARTPQEGADTGVWLCATEETPENGRYFTDREPRWPKRYAQSDEDAARLWDESARQVGLAA